VKSHLRDLSVTGDRGSLKRNGPIFEAVHCLWGKKSGKWGNSGLLKRKKEKKKEKERGSGDARKHSP